MRQVGGFSPGTLVSSTNKIDRHDITEILMKVALNIKTITPKPNWTHLMCQMNVYSGVVFAASNSNSYRMQTHANNTLKRRKGSFSILDSQYISFPVYFIKAKDKGHWSHFRKMYRVNNVRVSSMSWTTPICCIVSVVCIICL